jgi:hypothetical protein
MEVKLTLSFLFVQKYYTENLRHFKYIIFRPKKVQKRENWGMNFKFKFIDPHKEKGNKVRNCKTQNLYLGLIFKQQISKFFLKFF